MEFVIWGVGVRGKRAAKFVGYSNVVAFVDSDERLVGTYYEEIPIVHFEALIKGYRDCFLIVSPAIYEDIIKVLEEKKIDAYFLFNDCPSAILHGKVMELQEISFSEINLNKTIIHGSSLYSILLWKNFHEMGYDIPLVLNKDISVYKEMLKKISHNFYCEEELSDIYYDIIIQTMKYIPDVPDKKMIDLYHIDGRVDKFYHPQLHKFKNIGKGKRCFIVGNGSSISLDDLNRLNEYNEVCFGMNGIPLIFQNTQWRPKYYVCEDAKAMEIFGNLILDGEMNDIFLSDANGTFLERVGEMANINVFHMAMEDYYPDLPGFSADIERYVYNGRTVTYVCMQIAVYMGFQEIYLLGIDFDYEDGDTTQVKHFIKGYHMDSDKINPCRRSENLLAYQAARNYADSHEVNIFNATRGGKLEVFKRVEFDDLF